MVGYVFSTYEVLFINYQKQTAPGSFLFLIYFCLVDLV